MKKTIIALALAGISCGLVSNAFAADTADLNVTGTVSTGACTPTLDNGGVADYGSINVSSLEPSKVNQLGSKHIAMSVSCTSATSVGVSVVDDRDDSVAPNTKPNTDGHNTDLSFGLGELGLGTTAQGVDIGAWTLQIEGANGTNGTDTYTQLLENVANMWNDVTATMNASAQIVAPTGVDIYTMGDGNGSPTPVTAMNFDLVTNVAVAPTDTLSLTDDTSLDGQATISLDYL